MYVKNYPPQFLAIWRRALNLPSLESLTTELIYFWAKEKKLLIDSLEEKEIGSFTKIKCIILTSNGFKACFPTVSAKNDPNWKNRKNIAHHEAKLWEKVEWFSPLWIPKNQINEILSDIENQTPDRAIELFNYHTSTIYTLAFEAVCITQIMPQARSLREFSPLARESYLAFYSGYKSVSIAALIPAIEGTLTRIVSGISERMNVPDKINLVINRAIDYAARIHFNNMWVPREYLTLDYLFGEDERIFAFETFRRFLQKSFFCDTNDYDGVTWLNRHTFAHAITESWQQGSNFPRLIVSLATLGVIESWHDESNQVSLFFPEMSEDSVLLWQQALFRAQVQMAMLQGEEKLYHEHGRLVPELPNDDGVTLRKAILSQDCIDDLVRPLRDAGWSVRVGEPDDRALHITVLAHGANKQLQISLLYSCATENAVYKKLAQVSDVILYRGSPYHQEQYAYGITKHVGPVTGWQPPLQRVENELDQE